MYSWVVYLQTHENQEEGVPEHRSWGDNGSQAQFPTFCASITQVYQPRNRRDAAKSEVFKVHSKMLLFNIDVLLGNGCCSMT